MKKIVRLTESDLIRLVKRVINENLENSKDESVINNNKYQVNLKEENRGTIITPFFHDVYGKPEVLEVNFSEIYDGMFSFAKYGVIQFNIKADNIKTAVEMAKDRLNDIFKNGYPKKNDIVVVTGFRYDVNNNKNSYNLSFMENTHIRNQFTAYSYETKAGDLLKYDSDGDGFGFWYAVDKNGKRVSDDLKGGIFIGYLSDGVIKKYQFETLM